MPESPSAAAGWPSDTRPGKPGPIPRSSGSSGSLHTVKLSLALSVQHLADLLLQLKDLPILFSQFLTFVGRGLLIGVPATVNEFLKKKGRSPPAPGDGSQRPAPAGRSPVPAPDDTAA